MRSGAALNDKHAQRRASTHGSAWIPWAPIPGISVHVHPLVMAACRCSSSDSALFWASSSVTRVCLGER